MRHKRSTEVMAYEEVIEAYIPKKLPFQEENMYNKEQEQQTYLRGRLADVAEEKDDDLRKQFYIEWNDFPKTPADMRQRVAEGRFTWNFNDRKDDAPLNYGTSLGYYLSWRSQPADEVGYEKATDQLQKDRTAVQDQIYLSYEAGLAALQDFEAKTYH